MPVKDTFVFPVLTIVVWSCLWSVMLYCTGKYQGNKYLSFCIEVFPSETSSCCHVFQLALNQSQTTEEPPGGFMHSQTKRLLWMPMRTNPLKIWAWDYAKNHQEKVKLCYLQMLLSQPAHHNTTKTACQEWWNSLHRWVLTGRLEHHIALACAELALRTAP